VGEALQIVDESGRLLWSRAYDVNFEKLASGLGGEPGEEPVVIRDIDGDGLPEVVVSPPQPLLWADKAVSVFNADGSLRFRVDPRHTVRFGDRSFAGPWVPYRTFTLPGGPGAPPQLWLVFIHGMWFPSFAVHLSPAGEPLDSYWSDGYIELVQAMRWRGQDGVVFAGTNNETRSASLAFLIASSAHGAAPSASPDYRCSGCPEGEPAEFLLFPRRCLALALNGQPTIRRVWQDDLDRLHVEVQEGQRSSRMTAWYTIGPDLSVVEAKYSDDVVATHERLRREGVLDHSFEAHSASSLYPVRRWAGGGYQDLIGQESASEQG
jgi:hypothetical protein